jgi:hypothetical protein
MSARGKGLIVVIVLVVILAIAAWAGHGNNNPASIPTPTCTPSWTKECPYGSDGTPNPHYFQQQQANQVCKQLGVPKSQYDTYCQVP